MRGRAASKPSGSRMSSAAPRIPRPTTTYTAATWYTFRRFNSAMNVLILMGNV